MLPIQIYWIFERCINHDQALIYKYVYLIELFDTSTLENRKILSDTIISNRVLKYGELGIFLYYLFRFELQVELNKYNQKL